VGPAAAAFSSLLSLCLAHALAGSRTSAKPLSPSIFGAEKAGTGDFNGAGAGFRSAESSWRMLLPERVQIALQIDKHDTAGRAAWTLLPRPATAIEMAGGRG
jgi:hypothetical protein